MVGNLCRVRALPVALFDSLRTVALNSEVAHSKEGTGVQYLLPPACVMLVKRVRGKAGQMGRSLPPASCLAFQSIESYNILGGG